MMESIATGIKDLLKQINEDSSKKCMDYDVDVVDFFKAENYYNNLINSFDNPTSISLDVGCDEIKFDVMSKEIDVEKLNALSSKYKLSKDRIMLALFLFNLTKFSFSQYTEYLFTDLFQILFSRVRRLPADLYPVAFSSGNEVDVEMVHCLAG